MDEWNNWKETEKWESQADTYIERRFEKACYLLHNGHHILNEWRARKRNYISYTDTTIFDFQHYSRHDVSHSVNILQCIELVLGKERIENLSAGDLWLILESAYFHDIGMSLNYPDLLEVWKDEKFQTFIRTELAHAGNDYQDARNWYTQMDNLLHDRRKMEGLEEETEIEFDETWPVEAMRRLLFLVADYIRRGHGRRAKKFLERFSCLQDSEIQDRLYHLVVDIAEAHGENFEFILLKLKIVENGFGTDKVHPRFVAALLRLGDLLDMDNNRFSIRAVEHFGKLPVSSLLHVKKHKAMTHLQFDSRKICAEAISSELEVCQTVETWFAYIRKEIENLIIHWNEMAPKDLGGCIMQKAECRVYYEYVPGKMAQFSSKSQRQFEVDKTKLTELLIGTNIYDTKMDFLREYIQNALDATKMQIWLGIKEGKYRTREQCADIKADSFSPLDLSQELYDDYAIEVNAQLDKNTQKVLLEVVDHGIGMEEGCIDAISKIGAGWRERKEYNREVPQMISWLRPTGGFGIGVQSAFMVTDQIEVITKSEAEKETHKLTLTSPRTTGKITDESSFKNIDRGTRIRISFEYSHFEHWNQEYEEWKKQSDGIYLSGRTNTVQKLIGIVSEKIGSLEDIFSENTRLNYIGDFLTRYLEEIIADSFIPIKLSVGEKRFYVIKSKYLPKEDYWKYPDKYIEKSILYRDKTYRCICDLEQGKVFLWDVNGCVLTTISQKGADEPVQHIACFKNICVVRNTDFYLPYASALDICIDLMGHKAEDVLKVHRNAFNENFEFRRYLDTSVQVYLMLMKQIQADAQALKKDSDRQEREKLKKVNEIGEKLLRLYPQSWIYELYLQDSTSLKQLRSDTKLEVPVCQLDIQRKEEKDDGEVAVIETKRQLALKHYPDVVRQIRQFFKRDNSAVIFLKRKYKERLDYPVTTIGLNQIRDWLDKDSIPEDDDRRKANKTMWEILDEMKAWEYTIFYDENLVRSFLEYGSLKKREFRFDETVHPDRESVYVMLAWAENGKKLEEKELYAKAYKESEVGRKRYIGGETASAYYPKLSVSQLPYSLEIKEQGPYIISPINEAVRGILSLKAGEKKTIHSAEITFDEFLETVYEKGEFEALVEWVYHNQASKETCDRKTIKKEYERFLENIYNQLP